MTQQAGALYPENFFGLGSEQQFPLSSSDRYSKSVRDFEGRYPINDEVISLPRAGMREPYVSKYSWALPSDEVINIIAGLAQPIVEPFAGTGYWCSLFKAQGVDAVAYDVAPPTERDNDNHYHSQARRTWCDVQCADVDAMPWNDLAHRILFMCWAPYGSEVGAQAVRAYASAGGKTVIAITEGRGGCVGSDSMFDLLGEGGWDCEVDDVVEPDCALYKEDPAVFEGTQIPQWYGLNDFISCYKRDA